MRIPSGHVHVIAGSVCIGRYRSDDTCRCVSNAVTRKLSSDLVSDKWIPNPRPFPARPPHEWPAGVPAVPEEPTGESESTPTPAPHRGRAAMILGVIAVALAAAVVTYAVLRVIRPPARRVVAPPATVTPASTTTTTTLPRGPAITPAQLSRLTDELIPFVEQQRQLKFTTHPTTLLENDATYQASLRAYLARSRAFLGRLSTPFEVLGMNPNDADMTRSLDAFWGTKSAVFYDTVHNIVHVRAVPATPYLSTVLVVGLTSELDDQHFPTDQIAAPRAYGEDDFGMATLAGGDAWRIAAAWAATRPPSEQNEIRVEMDARRGDDTDTSKIPSALADWFRYPADQGVRFTMDLVTSRSSAPLDSVFTNPPDGSAQVMAPARIAGQIGQLPVAVPIVDGKVSSSGTFGAFFLESLLAPVVPDDVLSLAMDGYRGDSLVAYDSAGSGACVRMEVTTGDSAPDNMHRALTQWASTRQATVTLVADPQRPGRRLVQLDMCTGGGNSGSTTTTTSGPAGSNPSSTVQGGPSS